MHANPEQYGVTLAGIGLAVILAGCGGGGGGASMPAASGNVASTAGQTAGDSDTLDSPSQDKIAFLPDEKSPALPEQEVAMLAEAKLSNDSLLITVPQDQATDVALDHPIVLAYREKLDPAAVISVSLLDLSGLLPSSFYLSQSTIVVVPEIGLKPGTVHTVRVVTTTAHGGTEKTVAQITFTTREI